MKEAISKPQESRVIQPKSTMSQLNMEQLLANYHSTVHNSMVVQRVPGAIESGDGIRPYGIVNLNTPQGTPQNVRGYQQGRRNRQPIDTTLLDGMTLKHYMVVQNGTQFQFAIRAIANPYTRQQHERALRPEPIGGTQSWADTTARSSPQTGRNRTLGAEYFEETGSLLNPQVGAQPSAATEKTTVTDANVKKSVYFRGRNNFNAQGTVSIVESQAALNSTVNPNLTVPTATASQKEMKGTIVIDTANINGQDEDTVATEIKNRIIRAQKEFIITNTSAAERATLNIAGGTPAATAFDGQGNDLYIYPAGMIEDFGNGSEILLMLVQLIAKQVVARNRPPAPVRQPGRGAWANIF